VYIDGFITDEESAALERELRHIIDDDRSIVVSSTPARRCLTKIHAPVVANDLPITFHGRRAASCKGFTLRQQELRNRHDSGC
jgi:hypothetical protein